MKGYINKKYYHTSYMRSSRKNWEETIKIHPLAWTWVWVSNRGLREFWREKGFGVLIFLIGYWGFDLRKGLNRNYNSLSQSPNVNKNTPILNWTSRHVKIDFKTTQPNLGSGGASRRQLPILPHEIFEDVRLMPGAQSTGIMTSRNTMREWLHILIMHAAIWQLSCPTFGSSSGDLRVVLGESYQKILYPNMYIK